MRCGLKRFKRVQFRHRKEKKSHIDVLKINLNGRTARYKKYITTDNTHGVRTLMGGMD